MAGILFLRTRERASIVDFYRSVIGMDLWLEQAECTLLRHGNFLLGFCSGPESETSGLITFFYPDRAAVDGMYETMKGRAESPPVVNDRYRIYHFYAADPEDRALEFQTFLDPAVVSLDGESLLTTRRSVRAFRDDPVPDAVLACLFEACRYAPTSMNSQSYDYVLVRNPDTLKALAALRGNSSAPLARAPLGVAVCGDPARSGAHRQDAVIAAYHLLLAAWNLGLGTCWIGAMDRGEVKEALGIPSEHTIATVTPLGYPDESPVAGERREGEELYRVV
ncbi:MAG: nitroreductase family protein [Planctomycetota bacterium]|jgi:nitroreductase